MTINIPFFELQDILKAKTGKDVLFRTVNDNTVSIGYDLKVKLPVVGTVSKTVWLNITIDEIVDEDLHLTYEAGLGGDLLIKTLQKVIPSAKYLSYVDVKSDKKVIVHLHKIEDVHRALQQIDVEEINFKDDEVILMFKFKL